MLAAIARMPVTHFESALPGTNPDLSELPEYEPGLDDVVGRARARNLHFSTVVEEVIATVDMVFISVNTHHQDEGPVPARWPKQRGGTRLC